MFAVGIDECWHVELIVFRFIKVRTKTGMITVTFIIQHYSTQCMKKKQITRTINTGKEEKNCHLPNYKILKTSKSFL